MTKEVRIKENIIFGNGEFNIIAGPCSVENYEQMDEVGNLLVKNNIKLLRGGAFKPRTNPRSFQGLGIEGLELLKEMKEKYNLAIVSEVIDINHIELLYDYIDIFQIGTRNMYNYSLLKELGIQDKAVLLKRGMSATIKEWIDASEYIRIGGNEKIILCERGIRTFETYTRNTLDLMSIPIIHNETDLPIIVDPSHGTGRKELIIPAIKAAKALEADGAIVEIHPNPEEAYSDGFQSLNFSEFNNLLKSIK